MNPTPSFDLPTAGRCGRCGSSFDTMKDMIAHQCPLGFKDDPTPEDIRAAVEAQRSAAASRASKVPDAQNLMADVTKLCQAVIDGWDSEVEAIIILAPKGVSDPISYGAFTSSRERTQHLLKTVTKRVKERDQHDLKAKAGLHGKKLV